jgi:hypothetical protein
MFTLIDKMVLVASDPKLFEDDPVKPGTKRPDKLYRIEFGSEGSTFSVTCYFGQAGGKVANVVKYNGPNKANALLAYSEAVRKQLAAGYRPA